MGSPELILRVSTSLSWSRLGFRALRLLLPPEPIGRLQCLVALLFRLHPGAQQRKSHQRLLVVDLL